MAKYHKVKYALIAQCRQNKDIAAQERPGGWFGFIDKEPATGPMTQDEAIAWVNRAAESIIAGGDSILVIDDF